MKLTKQYKIPEFLEVFFYLIVTVILVYFVDTRINTWISLLIFPVIWYSKRDYLWLAFFIVVVDMPGGLFSGGIQQEQFRLPIYVIGAGISFTFYELFVIVIFIKSLSVKRIRSNYSPPFCLKELRLLLGLFIVLILISIPFGFGFNSISAVFKTALTLTLFYSVFYLINSKKHLINFFKILFPFVFVALVLQIYGLINGEQFVAFLKPGSGVEQGSYNIDADKETWQRPIEMAYTVFLTFSGSLFLLSYQLHNFKKWYLALVNLLSYIVILLTGTRGWFIAFSFGYVAFFLFSRKILTRLVIRSGLIILLVIFLITLVPVINKQIKNAWSRIITIESVVKGDITAGGTLGRFNIRAPRVMEGFYSSSIILGAGFSDLYFTYEDGHIGYNNLLLNAGVLGFLVIIYSFWKLLRKPFSKPPGYKFVYIRASTIPLIMLLILNTGFQTIGFNLGFNRIILIIFSIMLIDMSIKQSIQARRISFDSIKK